jgi:hypothetical protein
MLIVFDLSVSAMSSMRREVIHERVCELIYAHRAGRNLVVFSRVCCEWIKSTLRLSQVEASVLAKIYNGLSQTGNLEKIAKKFIRITEPGRNISRNGDHEILLPIDYRDFANLLLAPILVVEDIEYDAMIYRGIFDLGDNRPGGHPAYFDPAHGGGARMLSVTREHATQGRIVCAILDSDRVTPMQVTCKIPTSESNVADLNWPFIFFFELPCAEIENVIPLDIYANYFVENHPLCVSQLLQIDAEEERQNIELSKRFWSFFDIKRGVDDARLSSMDGDAKSWIISKISLLDGNLNRFPISGFGRKALSILVKNEKFHSDFRKSLKSTRWQTIFSDFTANVYWIVIAPHPLFVT